MNQRILSVPLLLVFFLAVPRVYAGPTPAESKKSETKKKRKGLFDSEELRKDRTLPKKKSSSTTSKKAPGLNLKEELHKDRTLPKK